MGIRQKKRKMIQGSAAAAIVALVAVSSIQVMGNRTSTRSGDDASRASAGMNSLDALKGRFGSDGYGDEAAQRPAAWEFGVTKTPDATLPVFEAELVAEGLRSPDGIAVDPRAGRVLVSEEDLHRIVEWDNGGFDVVVDASTPIFDPASGSSERVEKLTFPEGIAFGADGSFWAVEDRPGGRLIRFAPVENKGDSLTGEVVPIPGSWDAIAWEDVAVGPSGELLLAGSDLESVDAQGATALPSGVLLYRDREGQWWMPYRRLFSSFSSVDFSRNLRRAVYTCELTGETGWFDLSTSQGLGGQAEDTLKSPEGVCTLPDGRFLVAEEAGSIRLIDPGQNRSYVVFQGDFQVESLTWDDGRQCVWVSEDGSGSLLQLKPDIEIRADRDFFEYAEYHPMYGPQHVPQECPSFVARVLSMAGLHYDVIGSKAPISFQEFVQRVPLVAANARAEPLKELPEGVDPIEQVQFIVFHPGTLRMDESGVHQALAAFAVRHSSGDLTRTSLKRLEALGTSFEDGTLIPFGASMMAVPMPASITVSPLGIATITFLGLGEMPDYSLVLNPRNPLDSYMVVMQGEHRIQYRLHFPEKEAERDQWVIAYSDVRLKGWQALSSGAQSLSPVRVASAPGGAPLF